MVLVGKSILVSVAWIMTMVFFCLGVMVIGWLLIFLT